MRVVQLLLRGKFEEAWLYMNHVVLLTDDGDVLIASADQLRTRILEMTSSSHLAGSALFHSDFIYPSNRLQHIWANRLRPTFRFELEALPRLPLEISLDEVDWSHFGIPNAAGTPLDVHIYSRRLFLGSAGGLFSVDIEWGKSPGPTRKWRKRLENACLNIAAKYGAFVASCGTDGLLTSLEDFDWLSPYGLRLGRVRRVRDISQRARWVESSLVNYAFDHVEILKADREWVDKKKEIQVLRGFADQTIDVDEEFRRAGTLDGDEAISKVVANAGSSFLLSGPSKNIRLAAISRHKLRYQRFEVQRERNVESGNIEPLDYLAVRDGTLIEHYSGIIWVKGDGAESSEVLHEAVGKIRTFPQSVRYRNVFTAILNDGVLIAGLFDEEQLEDPVWVEP